MNNLDESMSFPSKPAATPETPEPLAAPGDMARMSSSERPPEANAERAAEQAPSSRADERTIRRIAEQQDGGIDSETSVEEFAAHHNPGGTHRKRRDPAAGDRAAQGIGENAETRGPDHPDDPLRPEPAEYDLAQERAEGDDVPPIAQRLENVPPRRRGGLSETRRGQ